LALFLGCGKDDSTKVSNLQSPGKETGNKEKKTTNTTPEKNPVNSAGKANSGRRPGERSGRGGRGNPFAELGVTASQQEELDAAREEMVRLFTPLFADRDMPREERESKMREIREAYMAKVKEILTEEQFAKYEEAESNRRQGQGSGRRPGGGFGGRGNSLASLNLSEDQQTKITAIQAEQRAEQTKLFQELRNSGGGFEGVREKMTELRTKYDKQIEALLTDEQKEKYREIQSQRRPSGGSSGGRRPGGGFNREKSKRPRDN